MKDNIVLQNLIRNFCKFKNINIKSYDWLERGSDERQFCSPNVDLPFCTLCRTKFGDYKEYHTSLDNLDFISSSALEKSFLMIKSLINIIEANKT